MTRFRSKSTVLPKPWQRGQAPKGLLKLKRRGSGSLPGRWQLLHSKARGEALPLARPLASIARNLFKDDFAGFAIGNLSRIHDARAILGADDDAIEKDEDGKREVEIEQRLRRGELDDLALLVEAVEAARRAVRRAAP